MPIGHILREKGNRTRKVVVFLGDNLVTWAYWTIPPFHHIVNNWYIRRPSGFNPTVDQERLGSIKLKIYRGQSFITADDARFLIDYLPKGD